jgi:hypothetical protein
MLIYDAALKTPYRILGINLPKDSLLHLSFVTFMDKSLAKNKHSNTISQKNPSCKAQEILDV